jgi:hypothetical protein
LKDLLGAGKIKIEISEATGMVEFKDITEDIDTLLQHFNDWENCQAKKL